MTRFALTTALAADNAFLLIHGIWTKPATGSQIVPNMGGCWLCGYPGLHVKPFAGSDDTADDW
ncbi:hypothetical protein CE91St64_09470 [Faecalicatena contorta]|nr:hypothetical protein CE91St64_09470 [Faecalicatena contorta]